MALTTLWLAQGWWWEKEEGVLAPQLEAGWAFTHACCACNVLRNLAMESSNHAALVGKCPPVQLCMQLFVRMYIPLHEFTCMHVCTCRHVCNCVLVCNCILVCTCTHVCICILVCRCTSQDWTACSPCPLHFRRVLFRCQLSTALTAVCGLDPSLVHMT